jgi:CDP-glycerol glycerophosphotransferase (TagB/SpsB family)
MDELKKRLDTEGRDVHNGLTVLLAPSWGSSSILVRYGSHIIDALLDTGYNLIIRPHPQSFTADKEVMDDLIKKYPDSDRLTWNRDTDNFSALNRADIMISDFSSVIFDYCLIFNKPFIYTENTFNKAQYDAAWLDEEMWKFRVLPSIGLPLKEEDFPNMKEIIQNAVKDEGLSRGRDQARAESWANIGQSAVLTVDYMMKKYDHICRTQEKEIKHR